MPVYSIEAKSVKRFSENPVAEQKHRKAVVCGRGLKARTAAIP
jgi:hypothetical protein